MAEDEKPYEGSLTRVESQTMGISQSTNELRREMKPRQVFMFSIACAIGNGLVIGSGTALARGGPASAFISYSVVGIVVFFVMTAIGEMAAFLPMNKGFGGYATRMVDPALGFAVGWNYFFKYVIAAPNNLTAAGLIIQYWRPDLNVAIWVAVFSVVVILINVLHVGVLGETEFWLSVIKVITLTCLIITCFVIAMGGGPNHDRSGFRFWNDPGAFGTYLFSGSLGRFFGWWASMVQACYAYTGTEVVGITFGEIPNPRKNIPRAVKQTFWRIFCFYILGILVLTMTVPYTNERLVGALGASTSAAASPFVVATTIAGIDVFPDIMNAALLVFVFSAASSDIYCASRSIYGLAKDGQAPKILKKVLKSGNPIVAVILSSLFLALGFLNAANSASKIFGYLTSLVTVFAVLNWIGILISHISFRRALKAQGIAVHDLPYVGIFQPWGSYFALFVSVLVIIFNGYDAFIPHFKVDTFILKYLGTVVWIFNLAFWKLWKKTKWIGPADVDLVSGRREFEEAESSQDANWNERLRNDIRAGIVRMRGVRS